MSMLQVMHHTSGIHQQYPSQSIAQVRDIDRKCKALKKRRIAMSKP